MMQWKQGKKEGFAFDDLPKIVLMAWLGLTNQDQMPNVKHILFSIEGPYFDGMENMLQL